VMLTVTDNDGLTADSTSPISVRQRPVAAFTYSPLDPLMHGAVNFDASKSSAEGGAIVSYEWNFGDGTAIVVESDPTTTHYYTQNGSFTVTLNVTDSEYLWDTESKVITVNPQTYYLTVKTSPEGITTIPGEGLYTYGIYVNLDAPAYVPNENGNSGQRYRFDHWDIDGTLVSGDPINVPMTANHTATAHYVLQYLITFAQTGLDNTASNTVVSVNGGPKSFSDMPFLLWADNGSSITYNFNAIISSTVTGKRFRLDSIGSPDSPFTVTRPETITGHYRVQYYLTLTATIGGTTNPPSGGWYDAGTPISVLAIPDPDYVLGHWELDGTPVGSDNPYNVLMNSAHTLHVVFEYSPSPPTRYYLTVKTAPLSVTSISGEGWYDEGSNVVLTAPNYVNVSTGSRYKFDYWDVDLVPEGAGVISITVRMDANHTATAHYTLQYYLTVTSAYDTPTPTSGWFNAGASITASVISPWAGSAGTRYVCTGWTGTGSVPASGTASSVAFSISAPSSIMWNWKTQYYLTIKTKPSGIVSIPGEGWYDVSTSVPLTAPDVGGYEFRYWDVDDVSQGSDIVSISVRMNAPHTATANYQPIIVGGVSVSIDPHSVNAWLSINSLLVAAAIVTASWVKRRKRKDA
ncbi:MAG: PKD domain-containing protein, partial [Candidatus Bathyarchaeia archaeon]